MPSQAAISRDTGDGWTAAKWRVMLMFALIVKLIRRNYYVNKSQVCFFLPLQAVRKADFLFIFMVRCTTVLLGRERCTSGNT